METFTTSVTMFFGIFLNNGIICKKERQFFNGKCLSRKYKVKKLKEKPNEEKKGFFDVKLQPLV